MNLYLLTQDVNRGYDTYDSCIVVAESEEEAKTITPSGRWREGSLYFNDWANRPEEVTAVLIGTANDNLDKGIVLSSFNAG